MKDFRAQDVLFADRPRRLDLLQLTPGQASRTLQVNVWRNHAIEPVLSLLPPFLGFAGLAAELRLPDYDDTLMFTGWQAAEAELIWLDSGRYTITSAWLDWLRTRLLALRALSTAPVILAAWFDPDTTRAVQELVNSLPAVHFADLGALCEEAGVKLLDPRTAAMAGTPLSNAAQPLAARALACHWLPGAILPPIKALALDLDQTLHTGILGEDGIAGVQLTPAHAALQAFAKSLQQRGIFLALVSRNEREDVEALFAQREDYPLRWGDFSATEISWGDKAAALATIARQLRIAPDAILFVDDNIGELAAVGTQLPGVHTIYAGPDAALTQRAIANYPGLWRWSVSDDDAKRVQDLKASAEREVLLAQAADPAEYFRSLGAALTYFHRPRAQLERLAQLCVKTNQFNLAMRRLNEVELAQRFDSEAAGICSVQLQDALSDSGVIALIVAMREGPRLVVEELCVSCRAMGRGLEDSIILKALRDMPVFAGCESVVFRVEHGPRNQPALDWLASLLGSSTAPAPGDHAVPAARVRDAVLAEGIVFNEEFA